MERLISELIITVVSPYYSILLFLLFRVVAGLLTRSIIGVNFKFGVADLQRGVGTGEFIPSLSEEHHIVR